MDYFSVFNLNMPAALQIVQSREKAAVLMHSDRLSLLTALDQPSSGAALARKLGIPRQKLNYHLRELEREGFLELVEERRKGNCMERVVRSTAQSFLISPQLTGGPAESRDRFSVSYLITAAARVISELANLAARARRAGKRLATLTLETEIRFATAESRNSFAEELATTVATLTAKYHAPEGRVFRLLTAVYPAGKAEVSEESVNVD
jgi:biotin operon repressor